MKSAVCAIAKDELQYLSEWIAYYLVLGFDQVVVYDNGSSDGTSEYLAKLSDRGLVRHVMWPSHEGVSPQRSAYKHAIETLRSEFEFVAFFDLDEFLVVPNYDARSYLNSVPSNVAAIAVNQLVFGSAGQELNDPELVVARFTKCCEATYDERKWFKSVVRPKLVSHFISPHIAEIVGGAYVYSDFSPMRSDPAFAGKALDIVADEVFLNHYILKSKQKFFEKKQRRGGAAAATSELRMSRHDDGYFYNRDQLINKSTFRFDDEFLVRLRDKTRLLEG